MKIQEAIKCMRHSRRTRLAADDVDCALSLRNVEVGLANNLTVMGFFFFFCTL